MAKRFRRRRSSLPTPAATASSVVSLLAAGGQPGTVPEKLLDPAARMHLLLAAVDHARSAKEELEAHHASELSRFVVGHAHKAQTKAVAHDFLAWHQAGAGNDGQT